MIYASTNSFLKPSSFTFHELQKSFNETSEKMARIAYDTIVNPIAIGIDAGLSILTVNIALEVTLDFAGISDLFGSEVLAESYGEEISSSFFETALLAPVVEEIVFRVIIQEAFLFIARKILPDMDVEIFSYKIKLDALVSIVATSILFGLSHLANGTGLGQMIGATVAGIALGVLKHEFGLLSAVSAHVTNNAICFGILQLIDA